MKLFIIASSCYSKFFNKNPNLGCFWMSIPKNDTSYSSFCFYFSPRSNSTHYGDYRWFGFSIRSINLN